MATNVNFVISCALDEKPVYSELFLRSTTFLSWGLGGTGTDGFASDERSVHNAVSHDRTAAFLFYMARMLAGDHYVGILLIVLVMTCFSTPERLI